MAVESQIIALLKNRDEQGLSFLFDHYGATIFGVITRIIKDEKTAEEVLQQSFLKAWNKIDSYDTSRSSLYTWLSAIARNTAIDITRLKSFKSNKKSLPLDTNVHEREADFKEESKIDSKNLLGNLEDKYKIVLDMMYLQGYTQAQISEELNIPLGTIKTRIRKALQILRQDLKNEKNLFLGMLALISLILLLCL